MDNELLFAARIAGIGRMTDDVSPVDFACRYQSLFSRYLDMDRLSGILNGSPEYEKESKILSRARALASFESDTSAKENRGSRNLASVFSRLSVTDAEKDRNNFYRYPFGKNGASRVWPEKKVSDTSREKLKKEFDRELRQLERSYPDDFETFQVIFDRICRQYLWCISMSDFEGEDISLYDNLKVTQAIAQCLIMAENEERPFILAAASFAGIQNYIFSIMSANRSGISKKLRARSFYVDLLLKGFTQAILDTFNVGNANILLQTGGKIFVLLPNTKDAAEKLKKIRNEFDEYLFSHFSGQVHLNFAWSEINDDGLIHYSNSVDELYEKLNKQKLRAFGSVLRDETGWDSSKFISSADLANQTLCSGCGQRLVIKGRRQCSECNFYEEIGGKLPHSHYAAFFREKVPGSHEVYSGYYFKLLSALDDPDIHKAYLIESFKDLNVQGDQSRLPLAVKYYVNRLPEKYGDPMTFQQIGAQSQGIERIGILKADVDNLGFLFSDGLRTVNRRYGTISRVHTLSRMLELFFSGYIQVLLESEEYKNVYSIFSGGDDLFLLGPWDVMLKLADRVRKDFRRFSANNPDVTLSAAVSMFKTMEHVAVFTENSEADLKQAKDADLSYLNPVSTSKNAISALGWMMPWEDFSRQLSNSEKIYQLIQSKAVPISVLRRLQQYSQMYKRFLKSKDGMDYKFKSMLAYDKNRNYREMECKLRKHKLPKTAAENMDWFLNEFISSIESIEGHGTDRCSICKDLYFADFVIDTALNKTRKERAS